ncbi:MAG: hypothetical protein KAT78_00925 [Flavobacteriaceae bacterium]|nr:hypothetical protein [Flavobacteriaceae bacterium]
MKREPSEILQLPLEQLEWLLSIKSLLNTDFYSSAINIEDLANNIKTKAITKGYTKINLLGSNCLEEFF